MSNFRSSIVTHNSRFLDFFSFFCPTLLLIQFNLIGQLVLPEILLAIILLLLVPKKGILLLNKFPKTIMILGIFWLFSQMVTDLIRTTPFDDLSRGWSKIIFLLISFSSIYLLLINNYKRVFLYYLGTTIGMVLFYYTNSRYANEISQVRFTYTVLIFNTTILVAIWSKTAHLLWPPLLFFVASFLLFLLDSRSMGGILMLAGGYLYLCGNPKMQQWLKKHRSLPHLLIFTILAGISAWFIIEAYGFAVTSGWFGEEAKEKYLVQTANSNILIGGRSEILVSSQAIMDSPIIGHGSWAKSSNYFDLYLLYLQDMGKISHDAIEPLLRTEIPLIPTHSHLFGAWVEAGILGAIFWIWVLTLALRLLYDLFGVKHQLLPLFTVVAINILWNILFSPIDLRPLEGFQLALLIIGMQLTHNSKKYGK
ncbi:MAG: hypothetical protein BWK78_08305 [Thiotrichaceae bacterium IS1]|nr:MAG: hypothetical protein BWK78_08305 [Thiotrichaceae bacterium IS1]